ncbi:MAG: DUF1566 domain-containing protein [Treponema sp.]|nr:DUF1566 domain-containing protein [Treponema sp.]
MKKKIKLIAIIAIIGFAMLTCNDDGDGLPTSCTNHDWGELTQTTAPDCTTEGEKTQTCKNSGCNTVNPDTKEIVNALGHDGIWTVTNSTTFPATSTGTCFRCSVTSRETQIGDTGPAGGKIIYIAPTIAGFEVTSTTAAFTTYTAYYLEAAPADAFGGTGEHLIIRWSTIGSNIPTPPDVVGTGLAIGSGRNNTALIIAAEKEVFLSDTYIYAALACDNYSIADFNDWFLPSRDELNQLYLRRTDFGLLPFSYYWSSSQYAVTLAWAQFFDDGSLGLTQGGFAKDNFSNVRAVRAF